MLDLLLSRSCGGEGRPSISDLNGVFRRACGERDASLVAVYLAHGISAEFNRESGTESPLRTALLADGRANGLGVARLLAANGVLFGIWNEFGAAYLREIESRLHNETNSDRHMKLEASRDCLLELIADASNI